MYNRWMPVQCSTELYHHGVKGMRWGVRRYQPYPDGSFGQGGKAIQKAEHIAEKGSARAFQKSMNRLARIQGNSVSNRAYYTERYNGYVTRQQKAKAAGKDKKAAKLEAKAWKERAKLEAESANAKVAAKKWAKIGADAAEKGYNVKLTKTYMMSDRAVRDQMLTQYLFGLIGGVATAATNVKLDSDFRKKYGTDYSPYSYDTVVAKVRKPKT